MWVFRNFLYKVVALLVACVLWSAAQGIRSVDETLDVPIEIENLSEDLVVVSQSVDRVNMRITGSRAAVRRARKDAVRYSISLAGVKPGEQSFPIAVDSFVSRWRGARVLAHSPSSVTFEIQKVVRKTVPVRVELQGEPAPGHRIAAVKVDPARVELAGARSELRRIREVRTEPVDVSRLSQTIDQDAALVPPGEHVWRAGEGLRGQPVRVEVRIEPVNEKVEQTVKEGTG
ncbi:MAG: YbbR-like domain-containing protein [Myxococcota bacterium]